MYEIERAEKMKVQEEYLVLKIDVNHWVYTIVTRTLKKNYVKIMISEEDAKVELGKLKEEKKIREDEKKKMKEEKKLEYVMFDLVKAGHAHKDKLKKIREICDE
jgi:hypothetical protein